jgi:surface antigen/peptidoglycan hydrolase CwlO-like protein
MILKIKKPLLKINTRSVAIFLVTFVIAISVPIQMMRIASAQTVEEINAAYEAKRLSIQQEIDAYNAQLAQLAVQSNTLQSAIASLNIQKAEMQAKINLSQAQYDDLVVQIANTEKKIKDNQEALGFTIANIYVDSNITPIEMLAGSKNISDYMDKQEYQASIRNQLTSTIAEIKTLKQTLSDQKIAVEGVLTQQNSQKSILVAKEAEQQNLLAQTQGKEAAYQQLTAQKDAEMAAANEQQRLAIARLTNNGKNTSGAVGTFEYRNFSGNLGPCGGGYPGSSSGAYGSYWGCNYGLDRGIDNWALYNRECVSYAAWAAYTRFGKNVTSFMGMGNAWQWPSTALSMGASVDNYPEVGSVAITPRQDFTPLGHAMMVEEVYGDGWIRVSQYNFSGTGEYSSMDLKVSSAVYVHFQDR